MWYMYLWHSGAFPVPQSGVQSFIRRDSGDARRCCPWRASTDIRINYASDIRNILTRKYTSK